MAKYFGVAFAIIFIDQLIKYQFIAGFRFEGECISLPLVFNKGVAFSMFAFLEEYLKWIQIAMLGGIALYIWKYVERIYYFPAFIILGAGISNIADRFIHGGVVDYIYWHCGFNFAIFNFADVMIDFGVAWILYVSYKSSKVMEK